MRALEYLQYLHKLADVTPSKPEKPIAVTQEKSRQEAFDETMSDALKASKDMKKDTGSVKPGTSKSIKPVAKWTGKGRVQQPQKSNVVSKKVTTSMSSKLALLNYMNKEALDLGTIRRAMAARMLQSGGTMAPDLFNMYARRMAAAAKPSLRGELESAGIDALRKIRNFDPKETIKGLAADASKSVGNWADRNAYGLAAGMYVLPNMLPSFSPTIKIKSKALGGQMPQIMNFPQMGPGGIRYAN